MRINTIFCLVSSLIAAALVAGCGGGLQAASTTATLGGQVTGLSPVSQLALQNGTQTVQVTSNGNYSIPAVNIGSLYNIHILTQPAGQTCTVTNNTGTVTGNVTNADVGCVRVAAKFAYVMTNPGPDVSGNPQAGTVKAYTVSAGALTPLASNASVATGANPSAMAVDPTGHYVFVSTAPTGTAGRLTAYSINATTGALTALATTVATGVNPSALAVDPSGKFVYVVNASDATISAYSMASGVPVSLGAAQRVDSGPGGGTAAPAAVTVDPSGKFVVVANGGGNTLSVFSILQPSGVLLGNAGNPFAFSASSSGPNPSAVAVGPAGTFVYTANPGSASVSVFGLNTSTGVLQPQELDSADTGARSLVIDPNGGYLIVVNADAGNLMFYPMNLSTGALGTVQRTDLGFVDSFASIALDPTGGYAFVTSPTNGNVYVFSINAATGAVALQSTVPVANPSALVSTIGPH